MLKELRLPSERKVKDLSKGMKTKLALILAFCSGRKFLILDEPTAGLDVASTQWFWETIEDATSKGLGVFISLHSFEQVAEHCHEVAVLEEGQLIDKLDLTAGNGDQLAALKVRMTEVG